MRLLQQCRDGAAGSATASDGHAGGATGGGGVLPRILRECPVTMTMLPSAVAALVRARRRRASAAFRLLYCCLVSFRFSRARMHLPSIARGMRRRKKSQSLSATCAHGCRRGGDNGEQQETDLMGSTKMPTVLSTAVGATRRKIQNMDKQMMYTAKCLCLSLVCICLREHKWERRIVPNARRPRHDSQLNSQPLPML